MTDVLHVLGSGGVDGTSIARIVGQLATGLRGRYRIDACFLGGSGPAADGLRAVAGEVFVLNWRNGLRDPLGALEFWMRIPKHNWPIVHIHYGGRSVRWLSRWRTNARIVAHHHGPPESPGYGKGQNQFPGADAVVAVSKSAASKVRGTPAYVVYPGVCPVEEESFRNGHTIGVAARLVPSKGLKSLLQALPRVREMVPDVQLQIAGSGPELASLREDSRGLGISNCVQFLGWREDLAALRSRWDLFVLPSLSDGFPLALLEAMAAGLPVVATDVDGIPELVVEGQTGCLVPPSDPAGLAQKIGQLLADPKRRMAMGAAGRDRVTREFSVDRMVESTADVYSRLL